MNAQIVINTLQKKISELTLVNVMLEAQIADLQNQLNSMNQDQLSENATDTGTVFGVTGNRGTVLIGDLELDTDLEVQFGGTGAGTFTSNGIVYGNCTSPLQVTAEANMASPGTGNDATTSYQVLTVTSAGVPVWTNTLDGGTF